MAIAAHFEESSTASDNPRDPRRRLRLEAQGAVVSGVATQVLVHNLSATGLLLESKLSLMIGEKIEIDLPQAGATPAKVIWASGELFGCQFHSPISAAALSAAQLRSPTGEGIDLDASAEWRSPESFGARLARLRKGRGLTLAQIATELGVSKPTVWAWEHGNARPIDSRIRALAEVLGVPSGDLLAGPDPTPLQNLLARSREQIAAAIGISPENIRIVIEI